MKISDRDYLEAQLHSFKLQLKEVEIKHRIAIAVNEKETKMLNANIDSIEKQLQG